MKNTIKIMAILLVAAMTICVFASCATSTYGKIKSAFESNNYEEVYDEETQAPASGTIETDEGVITYTIHVLEPKTEDKEGGSLGDLIGGIIDGAGAALQTVTVWEFGSDDELAKALATEYKDNADFQEFVNDVQNSDYVNGNCFLIPNILNPDATDIFKSTK